MNLHHLLEEQLFQLTGCRYSVLVFLNRKLESVLTGRIIGRPFKHKCWIMLISTMIKLRGAQAYRSLEAFLRIDSVTLHRYVNKVCAILFKLYLLRKNNHDFLIVDATCSRVRSKKGEDFSGHKHYKSRRVQMVIDDQKRIVSVSKDYHGSAHDKTIWNKEFAALKNNIDTYVLADKAYAGAKGENIILFRPIKRNEVLYKENKSKIKSYNRNLSKRRVRIEHVFAHLKTFKILCGIFPLQAKNYGTVFKVIALIYNLNLYAKHL